MMFANPTPAPAPASKPGDSPNRRYSCVLYRDCLGAAVLWKNFTCDACAVRVDLSREVMNRDWEPLAKLVGAVRGQGNNRVIQRTRKARVKANPDAAVAGENVSSVMLQCSEIEEESAPTANVDSLQLGCKRRFTAAGGR